MVDINTHHLIIVTGWYVGSTHPPELSTMKQETLVDIMTEELTQGADGSNAKCGVIGEIGCTWPLKGEGIDGTLHDM